MRKLRILACAYACLLEEGASFAGGEAVLGWNLVHQIARFHQVWVLTSASNRSGIEAELQRQAAPNVTFVYVELPHWLRPLLTFPGGIQFYAYLWQIQAYLVARKLHAQVDFDAFHHLTYANDWMASYIGAMLPVLYLRGPGGGAHRTPKAFLSEYPFLARAWEQFRSFGQWVLRRDPIYLFGQRRARAILLCNREAADAVSSQLKSKVQLFPVNGISSEDLRIFSAANGNSVSIPEPGPGWQRPCAGVFHVLSAGKLLGLKGHALAIRAFALFAKRHANVNFTIVGDGPERQRLESLVRNLNLERQVFLESWMPRPQLLRFMLSCDAFLFPSLRDGGGAVVVEAMAAGKAVVCFDLAGPGLHVAEECGIKIPAHNPDESIKLMSEALERLYQDRDLCKRMGRAGRARAETVYSWDRLGERLLKIYEQVSEVQGA
jgi:glycosyltransferase involved in cell wall biosynthesis